MYYSKYEIRNYDKEIGVNKLEGTKNNLCYRIYKKLKKLTSSRLSKKSNGRSKKKKKLKKNTQLRGYPNSYFLNECKYLTDNSFYLK
jgi:hypothetical protein